MRNSRRDRTAPRLRPAGSASDGHAPKNPNQTPLTAGESESENPSQIHPPPTPPPRATPSPTGRAGVSLGMRKWGLGGDAAQPCGVELAARAPRAAAAAPRRRSSAPPSAAQLPRTEPPRRGEGRSRPPAMSALRPFPAGPPARRHGMRAPTRSRGAAACGCQLYGRVPAPASRARCAVTTPCTSCLRREL